jgi:hypothetical protein
VASDQYLDLDLGLPVTPEDVEALRRLRSDVASWLLLDSARLQALIPPGGRRTRAVANDRWEQFSLD